MCRRLNRFVLPKFVRLLRKGQWHSRYLSVTRVLQSTNRGVNSEAIYISEQLRGAMRLRGDWISSRSVKSSPMRPLAWSQSVPLGAPFQLERPPAGERAGNHNVTCLPKVVSRVLGILREKFFSVMYINWSYYGVSVYQNAPTQEETYNEQAVILLHVSMCPIFLLFEENCLKLRRTTFWPVTRNFDTLTQFDVEHSSQKVVSTATF